MDNPDKRNGNVRKPILYSLADEREYSWDQIPVADKDVKQITEMKLFYKLSRVRQEPSIKLALIAIVSFISILFASCTVFDNDLEKIIVHDSDGVFAIVFNDSLGMEEQIDSVGNRVYEIPHTHILRTKFEAYRSNMQGLRYYQRIGDSLNNLPYFPGNTYKDLDTPSFGVYGISHGQLPKSKKRYMIFIVGRTDSSEYYYKLKNSFELGSY